MIIRIKGSAEEPILFKDPEVVVSAKSLSSGSSLLPLYYDKQELIMVSERSKPVNNTSRKIIANLTAGSWGAVSASVVV